MNILDEIKKEVSDIVESQINTFKRDTLKEMRKIMPKTYNITLPDNAIISLGDMLYHKKFEQVLNCVNLNLPIFLSGDAGSGKTTLAEQCAKALGLAYYCISVCLQTSETVFLGYKNAHGNYVRTLFREAYEHGGIFLIDEIDNGNPNILSVLNACMANGVCAFPDGMVTKHPNFRIIASGNTIGRGADRHYVGRLEMDLATLDRFVFIFIDYDETIEKAISSKEIFLLTKALREIVFEKKIRLIVSPRASAHILKLHTVGVKIKDAVEMCIFKGCDQSIKDQFPKHLEGFEIK